MHWARLSRGIGVIDALGIAVAVRRHRRVDRERLVEFRNARLRRLIAHAYESVPYYRALWERHGIRPDHIRTAADLGRIPVTSKRDLQSAHGSEVRARGTHPSRLLAYRTSGSTGEPLVVYRTWIEERLNTLMRLRAHRDFGIRARDVRVRLNAELGHVPGGARNWDGPQRLLRALGFHRKMVRDYRVDPRTLRSQIAAIRPDVLAGLPSVLAQVASVRAAGEDGLTPRVVVSGGDVLTSLDRHQIALGLAAPVFDLYGSHEIGLTAWQCPQQGCLHVADDAVIIEIVKDGRPVEPGETGEVIATRLHAFAMPFIRYRLGDLATRGPAPCRCGAPFSTITAIEGRITQYFSTRDGRLVHGNGMTALVYRHGADWVARFQFTQETHARFVLRVVPLAPPPRERIAALEKDAHAMLGDGSVCTVMIVDDIPLSPSGKFEVSRSLVPSAGQPSSGLPSTPSSFRP